MSSAAQVVPVHLDTPFIRVVEAGQQLHHRRLPRPGLADEGHRLPGRDAQIDATQRFRAACANAASRDCSRRGSCGPRRSTGRAPVEAGPATGTG